MTETVLDDSELRDAPPVRYSGVLLHPTSLPGPHGIGDLGDTANQFIDWLAEARQTRWQILPLGPLGYGDSPYASFSAFAGNPLLVSLDRLVEDGLLDQTDLHPPTFNAERIDYDAVSRFKTERLQLASERFFAGQARALHHEYDQFREQHAAWLDDYTLFMALRTANDDRTWIDWPEPLRMRDPQALANARRDLAADIDARTFMQFLFFRQWGAVKQYANDRGISIFGDVPIFVAFDSADVWANREQFQLDEQGRPIVVAGVPPDYFSETGQLWGNPLYDWERMRQDGYRWWVERFRAVYSLVDIARVDHFRAFEAYWAVPAGETTAVNGTWVPGPGRAVFDAVSQELGDVPVIAEDLGMITRAVDELRASLGFPGMSVLQFAFDAGPDNLYLPHNLARDTVVYTGTHDNNTTLGWYQAASDRASDNVRRYLGVSGENLDWDLIRAAFRTVAVMAIVPAQDILSLGADARMNVPGAAEGNWGWRMQPDALTSDLAERLRELTERYGRLGAW
jgi:4-alpha-glucanotransferase